MKNCRITKVTTAFFLFLLISSTLIYILNDHLKSNSKIAATDSLTLLVKNNMGGLVEEKILEYGNKLTYKEIIETINQVDSLKCHEPAHLIGEILYAQTDSISKSLSLCSDLCMAGCIHGVIIGGFENSSEESHLNKVGLESVITTLCDNLDSVNTKGTCLHGVGHAAMSVTLPKINEGLDLCDLFPDLKERYYCYTGAFMELIEGSGASLVEGNSELFPCDTYTTFPSACFRYKVAHLNMRGDELPEFCNNLEDLRLRAGCWHGIGKVTHPSIINRCELANTKTGNELCIEAVSELVTYFNLDGRYACEALTKKHPYYANCMDLSQRGLYSLDKDFTVLLSQFEETKI